MGMQENTVWMAGWNKLPPMGDLSLNCLSPDSERSASEVRRDSLYARPHRRARYMTPALALHPIIFNEPPLKARREPLRELQHAVRGAHAVRRHRRIRLRQHRAVAHEHAPDNVVRVTDAVERGHVPLVCTVQTRRSAWNTQDNTTQHSAKTHLGYASTPPAARSPQPPSPRPPRRAAPAQSYRVAAAGTPLQVPISAPEDKAKRGG